ncbi:MAG: hypothetical protein RJA44_1576 [Pseudomonadota bacterium]
MRTSEDITAIALRIEAGGRQVLFILLAADGTVNRQGTGTADNTESDLFIGKTKDPLFQSVRHLADAEVLDLTGRYVAQEIVGLHCVLTVCFLFADEESQELVFEYGSKSLGPPPKFAALVEKLCLITEPWYKQQKKMVRNAQGAPTEKPWWRFWK